MGDSSEKLKTAVTIIIEWLGVGQPPETTVVETFRTIPR